MNLLRTCNKRKKEPKSVENVEKSCCGQFFEAFQIENPQGAENYICSIVATNTLLQLEKESVYNNTEKGLVRQSLLFSCS